MSLNKKQFLFLVWHLGGGALSCLPFFAGLGAFYYPDREGPDLPSTLKDYVLWFMFVGALLGSIFGIFIGFIRIKSSVNNSMDA